MKKLVSLLSMVLAIILLTNSVNVSAFNPIARSGLNEEDKYDIDKNYIVHLLSSWKFDSKGYETSTIQVPIYTSYYWNNNFISQYKNSKISEAYKLLVGIDQIQYVSTDANTEKGRSFDWFYSNGGYSVLVGYLLGGAFNEGGIMNYSGYRKFFYEYKDKGYTTPYEMWVKEVYQPLRNYIEYQWSLIDKKLTKRFKSYNENDKDDKKYTNSLKEKYGKTFTYTKGRNTFTTNYKNFEYLDWTRHSFNSTYYVTDARYCSPDKLITDLTAIGKIAGIYTTKSDKKCKKVKLSTLKKYGMPTEYRDKLVKGFELINEDVDRICDISMNKWMYQQFDRTLDELEALKIEMLYVLNMIDEIAKYQFSPEHGAYSEYLWAYEQYQ